MTTGFAKQIHADWIGMNVIQTTRMTSTDASPTEKIQAKTMMQLVSERNLAQA